MSGRQIELRGVHVHNLKNVDLNLPHHQLIVICGVSGSGKTSLALDTLYAEGQRRYIETFSAYTRQFLERLEKPAADSIDGIPPAIAVTRRDPSKSSRATIATATETADYLRLLYAKIGRCVCLQCRREVRRESPDSAALAIQRLAESDGPARLLIGAPYPLTGDQPMSEVAAALRDDGYLRALWADHLWRLDEPPPPAPATVDPATVDPENFWIVVDRLSADAPPVRLLESLELAFEAGRGRCSIWREAAPQPPSSAPATEPAPAPQPSLEAASNGTPAVIDGRAWRRIDFATALTCGQCGAEYPAAEPRLFSFNSPLGACPTCEGFGNIVDIDMELVVPDPSRSLRDGAIAPWNSPAYAHELEELLALANDYQLPVDAPYSELRAEHRELIDRGVPERKFGGLQGFFAWLERRKYKTHIRIFLSRWRTYRTCPQCGGSRLRAEALATQVGGRNLAEVSAFRIDAAERFFAELELEESQFAVGRMMLDQVRSQLKFLNAVGLGYLTLDRPLRTLSGGEAQRVALSSALGSGLVNMLYVLDEPTAGLHPSDVERLVGATLELRDRRNTVVVVEHEEAMIRAADEVIEIGPGAGERGGQVVYQGSVDGLLQTESSVTGQYLSGARGGSKAPARRQPDHGWLKLTGARGHNLKSIDVEFPLGVLCLVTGVSGAGKSTLVQDTLHGALALRKHKEGARPLPFDDIFGDGQIDEVILVDQSAIGRSPRSNPVTYIKAFDAIRTVFSETVEARTHNYTAGHFSFNVKGGRCEECDGDGAIKKDMQFLADVYVTCPACLGTRYRREILEVRYRGKHIAQVLELTVREAFSFFRGQPKVQAKLKQLIDVGLDYLRLGQPANTLSAGESQRVKLAAHLSKASRNRTLFLLDEPTNGLHYSDIVQLLDAFDALLAVGHSLIVVEHNLQLMRAADYLIDLGPGAGDEGGQIVVKGTPERVSRHGASQTGRFLAKLLQDPMQESA